LKTGTGTGTATKDRSDIFKKIQNKIEIEILIKALQILLLLLKLPSKQLLWQKEGNILNGLKKIRTLNIL